MLINADFSKRAAVLVDQYEWVPSPQGGVERVMLDRIGNEKARATSIVRYAAASHFPAHTHPGGEEILVLSGTFSEDGKDFPAGWYMRSPPGSSHRPSSAPGATIFVKLRQMPSSETDFVRTDTNDATNWKKREDGAYCPLFIGDAETVTLERIHPGQRLFLAPLTGAELLVLEGSIEEGADTYKKGSWLRLPAGDYPAFVAGADGTTLYLKVGPFVVDPALIEC